jgi:hypothetical protein
VCTPRRSASSRERKRARYTSRPSAAQSAVFLGVDAPEWRALERLCKHVVDVYALLLRRSAALWRHLRSSRRGADTATCVSFLRIFVFSSPRFALRQPLPYVSSNTQQSIICSAMRAPAPAARSTAGSRHSRRHASTASTTLLTVRPLTHTHSADYRLATAPAASSVSRVRPKRRFGFDSLSTTQTLAGHRRRVRDSERRGEGTHPSSPSD